MERHLQYGFSLWTPDQSEGPIKSMRASLTKMGHSKDTDLVRMQTLGISWQAHHLMRFSLTRHLRHVRSELASAMYSLPYLPAS